MTKIKPSLLQLRARYTPTKRLPRVVLCAGGRYTELPPLSRDYHAWRALCMRKSLEVCRKFECGEACLIRLTRELRCTFSKHPEQKWTDCSGIYTVKRVLTPGSTWAVRLDSTTTDCVRRWRRFGVVKVTNVYLPATRSSPNKKFDSLYIMEVFLLPYSVTKLWRAGRA